LSPCHYRVSVKARVVHEGRLLVVREGSDRWDLPGGGLEHNEDVSDGLRREVQEELGVGLIEHVERPDAVLKCYDAVNQREVLALVFTVELDHFQFTLRPPVDAAAFVDLSTLGPQDFEPYLRSCFGQIRRLVGLREPSLT
jgi:ADP-ribose pyrophosphatase YjhB (NUDIX family)